jgi:hypothetical protein
VKRYKNYTELLSESKKIDCCTRMENETFPNIPDPDESPKKKISILEGEGLSRLELLEIAEARKSVKWFKKGVK